MSISFPTSLDALSNPASTDTLDSPPHHTQHADANDAIEALEAKVGINSSAVTSSLDYIITHLVNANIATGAAIALSKLATDPLARANHTGTQLAATISDFDTQVATTAVLKTLFDAQTILFATSDNTPAALTVAVDTVVGRLTGGNIASLNPNAFPQLVNAQTGTTYTVATGDPGKLVTQSNASAITTTVPQDSDVAFPIGCWVELYQLGAGQITVAQGTGATLRSTPTAKSRAQYSRLFLQKILANTWALSGDLAAT